MNNPAKYDLSIWVGNTWSQAFVLKQDGAAFDLTGKTLNCRVAHGGGTGEIFPTVTITDQTAGAFTLSLTDVQTRTIKLRAPAIQYEIELRPDNKTVLYGNVNLLGGVNADG